MLYIEPLFLYCRSLLVLEFMYLKYVTCLFLFSADSNYLTILKLLFLFFPLYYLIVLLYNIACWIVLKSVEGSKNEDNLWNYSNFETIMETDLL